MTQSLPADTQTFPADWYDDPHAPGGRVKRYWDGSAWTEFVFDLGVDIAAPTPGPTNDGTPPVALVAEPEPEALQDEHQDEHQDERTEDPFEDAEVMDEAAALSLAADPPPSPLAPKIGFFGARKAARQLAQENDVLLRQMSELSDTVARYEAELARMQAVLVDR